MENYDENREPLNVKYWNVNDLYGWAMSQKLPAGYFKWLKNTSHLNKDFMRKQNEDNDKGCRC